MSEPLWRPSNERIAAARITAFQQEVEKQFGLTFSNYAQLHTWSVREPTDFWRSVWDFCEIRASQRGDTVIDDSARAEDAPFNLTRWFPDARLNFAENLLRRRDDKIALISLLENGERREITYTELYSNVEKLADALRQRGVIAGDRVAGFLPNIPETVVAMLAASSIGAIWSSCSPDFGVQGVIDRFAQIKPKVLFAADGYYYNGKTIDSLSRLKDIVAQLDSVAHTVVVPLVNREPKLDGIKHAVNYREFCSEKPRALSFEQLPFDHPLYILYSSGTTGVPKCIVHGAGGTLLQHLKEHQLHTDIGPEDVLFYFTTCGWMMWNWLVSGLASECTVALYDGSPFARNGQFLLDAIDHERLTVFGTSAKFIAALEKAEIKPRESHKLSPLKAILSTGSPLSHESFDYVYRDFKADVCLSSISGGTDIISCFVLGNPTLPVCKGEIQCIGLGMAVDILDDDGNSIQQARGELVCTAPFPSCPIGFWNDDGGERFRGAYFDQYPGIWAHGDYGEITEHGGVIIHGRSDAVLNPGGVRIGTAEIYRQVEKVEEVLESIVIGQDWQDDVRVVLFVVLREGITLNDELVQRIKQTIRTNATPRHVPARIVQVPDIPRTISGKIVELAVRKVVHGEPVKNTDALANPKALQYYENLRELQE